MNNHPKNQQRTIKAQTLTEGVLGLGLIIGAVILGTLLIANVSLSAYYKGKLDLIASQVTLYAAGLGTTDPTVIKPQVEAQITILANAMNMAVPKDLDNNVSVSVDSKATPNIVSVSINLSNIQPIVGSTILPLLVSSTSTSAALVGSGAASPNFAGSIAMGTEIGNPLVPPADPSIASNLSTDLTQAQALASSITTAFPLPPPNSFNLNPQQRLGAEINQDATQLVSALTTTQGSSTTLAQQLQNLQGTANVAQSLSSDISQAMRPGNNSPPVGGIFGGGNPPTPPGGNGFLGGGLGNGNQGQNQKTLQQLQNLASQAGGIARSLLGMANTEQNTLNADAYLFSYSYLPVVATASGPSTLSSAPSPPASSSVGKKPVYVLGSTTPIVVNQDFSFHNQTYINTIPPMTPGGPMWLSYPPQIGNPPPPNMPSINGNTSLINVFYGFELHQDPPPSPNPFNNPGYFLGDVFKIPGLPVYTGLQKVTNSLPLFSSQTGSSKNSNAVQPSINWSN